MAIKVINNNKEKQVPKKQIYPEQRSLQDNLIKVSKQFQNSYLGDKVDKTMDSDRNDNEVQYVVPDKKSDEFDINQISTKLSSTAKRFGYTKGSLFDALEQNCFLCLSANDLDDLSAKPLILNYLREGGVLVVNSSKGYRTTSEQIFAAIPEWEQNELLPRVFFTASGGSILLPIRKDVKYEELSDYKDEKELFEDCIYLGETKIERDIKQNDGILVKDVVYQILNKAKLHPGQSLFSNEDVQSSARSMPEAAKLIEDTLRGMKGRLSINGLIFYCEHIINKSIRYDSDRSNALIKAFSTIQRNKDEILNFDKLSSLSEELQSNLNLEFQAQFSIEKQSWQEQMEKYLASLNLKKGDVIRILEPGNNDQITAMFMAQQVKCINDYSKTNCLDLDIEVLIMGKGGHATTAIFAQFAELIKNEQGSDEFYGTPEAISLGLTFKKALEDLHIKTKEVENFGVEIDKGTVKIKLAKESKNTGENVEEACIAFDERNVDHIFICSAAHQSMRQTQTFAQQYSNNPKIPLATKKYKTITSIPLSKSSKFIAYALDNFQAVTELYAGLGERARIYYYAYKKSPFIVPEIICPKELENLYSIYDKLSKTNNLDESKKESIEAVLKFFMERFRIMEKAITWSKSEKLQQLATQSATGLMAEHYRKNDQFSKSIKLFKKSKKKDLESEDREIIRRYEQVYNRAIQSDIDQREKYILYSFLRSKVTKLEEINNGC